MSGPLTSLLAESQVTRQVTMWLLPILAVAAVASWLLNRVLASRNSSVGAATGALAAQASSGLRAAAAPLGRFFRHAAERWQRAPKALRALVLVAFLAFCYLLPTWKPWPLDTPGNDFVSVLGVSILPYALIALGLNVVVGMAGLLDLGYVGFYAVGAYVLAILGSEHATLPWLLCLPVSVAVSMIAGVILGAPTLRLRGDYLAIVTLGFGEIIRLITEYFGFFGYAQGLSGIQPPPNVGPFKFGVLDKVSFVYLGLTLIVIVYILLRRIERSRVGRAWTAIREDEDAAELMGVPTFRFKLIAFAIGAGVGGLAGMLYASKAGHIEPKNFTINISILFLAAVVLGGSGNMPGAVLGAFLVSWIPERFRFLDTKRFLVFGLILVIMMIFRPQGILPRRAHGRAQPPDPPPFEDVREGDPDLEGGAHGALA